MPVFYRQFAVELSEKNPENILSKSPPLATPFGLACKDENKAEAFADQYFEKFKPNNIFCPITIDSVYDKISEFCSHGAWTSILSTNPEELLLAIKN